MRAYNWGQSPDSSSRSAKEALRDLIDRKNGALTVFDYMAFCLHDAEYGYYSTKRPLGREGDFVTSPEISQVFGELIGLWIVNMFEALGQPKRLHILELGPGRGLLMKDALQAFAISPPIKKAMQLHMVEINPYLRKDQTRACAPYHINHFYDLATALSQMGDEPLIVIANEFFDAFPVNQYIYQNGQWFERTVIDTSRTKSAGHGGETLKFSHKGDPCHLENLPAHQPVEGDIWEDNTLAYHQIDLLSAHISKHKGAGLVIDYGYSESEYGETLQAISRHEKVSIFSEPGSVDLTTHVNFESLQNTVRQNNLATTLGTQGQFLSSMGIHQRTEHMATSTDDIRESQAIREATTRLTHSLDMGTLFKVLSFWNTGSRA